MQNNSIIGFIGAGNMTNAIIKGLIDNGYNKDNIIISDIDDNLLKKRQQEFAIKTYNKNSDILINCDIVILAVKPQNLHLVCLEIKDYVSEKNLILSIVAGINLANIYKWLGKKAKIIRAMPNTPILVKKGVVGLFANELVANKEKNVIDLILSKVSSCFWLKEEQEIDAITAISGSGPAYFLMLMEIMTAAAIEIGIDEKIAKEITIKTALGASIMADNSDKDSKQLRVDITSKKGTTEAAINYLEEQKFRDIMTKAIKMAFNRAKALQKEIK